MIEIQPRELTALERGVLERIYSALPSQARLALSDQLDSLEVFAQWAAGSASVDIRPREARTIRAAPVESGVLPVRAVVFEGRDVVGEVIVWIDSGILVGLEYAYYLGDTPAELPLPEKIVFL